MNPTPHDGHGRNGGGHKPGAAVSATCALFVSTTCEYSLPSPDGDPVPGGAGR
jgi:hypothetical protein